MKLSLNRHRMKLWFSDKIPEETKQAKLAQISKFGDIYKPRDQISNEYSAQSYFNPVESHVHCNNDGWHNDINYEGYSDRKPALLIGDPGYSFLWNRPMIFYKPIKNDPDHLTEGQKKSNVQRLLNEQLREQRP